MGIEENEKVKELRIHLPVALMDRLKKEADNQGISLDALIVALLQWSLTLDNASHFAIKMVNKLKP